MLTAHGKPFKTAQQSTRLPGTIATNIKNVPLWKTLNTQSELNSHSVGSSRFNNFSPRQFCLHHAHPFWRYASTHPTLVATPVSLFPYVFVCSDSYSGLKIMCSVLSSPPKTIFKKPENWGRRKRRFSIQKTGIRTLKLYTIRKPIKFYTRNNVHGEILDFRFLKCG